jgi:Arc/MetJ family transcription regulator
VYTEVVKRVQIHLTEDLDEAAEREAARRGVSKAALIRSVLSHELAPTTSSSVDPWAEMVGWLQDGPVDNIDAVIYDHRR